MAFCDSELKKSDKISCVIDAGLRIGLQNSFHFLNRVRVKLGAVIRIHDQLRLRAINMDSNMEPRRLSYLVCRPGRGPRNCICSAVPWLALRFPK